MFNRKKEEEEMEGSTHWEKWAKDSRQTDRETGQKAYKVAT